MKNYYPTAEKGKKKGAYHLFNQKEINLNMNLITITVYIFYDFGLFL